MTVRELIEQSAEDLRRRADEHRRLLASLMSKAGQVNGIPDTCFYSNCPHQRRLRETITETIEVLEGTRKAFKSRQLEVLRKKLIRTLAECE